MFINGVREDEVTVTSGLHANNMWWVMMFITISAEGSVGSILARFLEELLLRQKIDLAQSRSETELPANHTAASQQRAAACCCCIGCSCLVMTR